MKIKRVEHVAIACRNMSDSMKMLESIFGFEKELEETIGTTNLAMYPVGETYIELLESSNPKSKIAELIKEKNQSLYHLLHPLAKEPFSILAVKPISTQRRFTSFSAKS